MEEVTFLTQGVALGWGISPLGEAPVRLKACDFPVQGNALDWLWKRTAVSQSVARNLIHLVFSTKHRQPLITGELNPDLFAYLVGTAKGIDCPAIIVGGVADHVHILFALHKTVALCKAVEELKKESSKWAKEHGGPSNFYWQNGYGAFSVSPPNVPRVSAYVANQAQHHAALPYQDEFRGLLYRAGEECDERTVWD